MTYEQEIMQTIKQLTPDDQRRVLDYARGLVIPEGESGARLVEHVRTLGFSSEDVADMQQAIVDHRNENRVFPEVDLDG